MAKFHTAHMAWMKEDIMNKLRNFQEDEINEIADKMLDLMYPQSFNQTKLDELKI